MARHGLGLFRADWYVHASLWTRGLDPIIFYQAALQILDPPKKKYDPVDLFLDYTGYLLGHIYRRLGHLDDACHFLRLAAEVVHEDDAISSRIDAELGAAHAGRVSSLEKNAEGAEATVYIFPFGGSR